MPPSKIITIDVFSDPVWPGSPELEPLDLPLEYRGHAVLTYQVKMELIGVEILVQEDPEKTEWVSVQ